MIMIREYVQSDLPSCVSLIKEGFLHFNKGDLPEDKLSDFLDFFDLEKHPKKLHNFFALSTLVLVAESENGSLLGVLRSIDNRIQSFYVDKDAHHQGIARKLFEAYQKAMLLEGWDHLLVFSSSYALGFYQKMGFKRDGEKWLRGGVLQVYPMKKML